MPTTPTLNYLHLSDLHFRIADDARLRDQKTVSDSLLKAIEENLQPAPYDFIVITGDIAFSGQREEYELALAFCEKLLAITGVEKSRLYPGGGQPRPAT